jgi:hypothetical protein
MDMSPPSPLSPLSDGLPAHPSPPRQCSSRVPIPTSRILTNDGLNCPWHSLSFTTRLLDYQDADVVLQSCDLHDFCVQKVFLSKSSSKFDSLIKAASCLSEATNPLAGDETPLPVVHLPEGSKIISYLLSFILPIPPVLPPTLEEILELLSVVQKYDLLHVLVHIQCSIALKEPPLINKTNSLHVYSLARTYCLNQEMVQAAHITLRSTLTIESIQDNLDLMPAADHLHELWRYHQRVKASLMGTVGEFRLLGACAAFGGCVLGPY